MLVGPEAQTFRLGTKVGTAPAAVAVTSIPQTQAARHRRRTTADPLAATTETASTTTATVPVARENRRKETWRLIPQT